MFSILSKNVLLDEKFFGICLFLGKTAAKCGTQEFHQFQSIDSQNFFWQKPVFFLLIKKKITGISFSQAS